MSEFKRRKLSPKTLSEILKNARKKKELSLEQAEEETKVRARYLRALEEGHYDALPNNVYALGFLSKYADFLGLPKEETLNLFKIERGEKRVFDKLAPQRNIKDSRFFITPKTFVVLGFTLVIAAIFGYIVYSVRVFTLPPNLVITSPSTEQVVKEDQVNIIGKTDEGSTLMINNQAVLTDDNGNFGQVVKLSPGLNSFEVRSISRSKKETIKNLKILAQY
jgi:cytoskeletal protein RodZ